MVNVLLRAWQCLPEHTPAATGGFGQKESRWCDQRLRLPSWYPSGGAGVYAPTTSSPPSTKITEPLMN